MLDGFYNPKFVGIVLDVSNFILEQVKQQLIPSLKSLDSSDKVYIYHPEYQSVPLTIGKSIGNLGNYIKPETDIGEGVAEAIFLFCEKDLYAEKCILIIIDNYDFKNYNSLLKAIKIDIRHDFEIKFHIIGVGQQARQMATLCEERANINFHFTELNQIGETVLKIMEKKYDQRTYCETN